MQSGLAPVAWDGQADSMGGNHPDECQWKRPHSACSSTAQVIKQSSAVSAKREAMLHAEEGDQPIATLDIYEG